MLLAPTGRANTAQANGLGNSSQRRDVKALKGRNKTAVAGGPPRMFFRAVSPFQGSSAKRSSILHPGRWPGLWSFAPSGLLIVRVRSS